MSLTTRLLPLVVLLLPAACTTAFDATRRGKPVIATTIDEIEDAPEDWDGRWVQLEGWIDDKGLILSTSFGDGGASIKLDPQKRSRSIEGTYYWEATKRAAVSGQVDLTCWRFWQETHSYHAASFKTDRPILEIWASGPLEYCNRATGPYLERAVVTFMPETRQ